MTSINTHTQENSSDPRAETGATDEVIARKRRKVGTANVVEQEKKSKAEAPPNTKTDVSAEEIEGCKGRDPGSADGGDWVAGTLGPRFPLGNGEEEARSFAHQRDRQGWGPPIPHRRQGPGA